MNIFNYESKFNQMLLMIADMIILNILYILCCIPIFTIGAAQAGMFTGMRVLMDKEDDSSVAKAFFRGFSNGFKSITIVTCVYSVLLCGLLVTLYATYGLAAFGESGAKPAFIVSIIAACLVYTLHTVTAPFHATFGCTTRQLFRNSLYITLAYLLRSVISAGLIILPAILFFVKFNIFLAAIIGLLAIYYSIAYFLILTIWKKPFQSMKDAFYAAQSSQQEQTEESAPEEIEESIPEETEE